MENVFRSRNRVKPIVYHLRDVTRDRASEGVTFRLRVPSLQITQGEKIALIGESGCGKSTLLDMLAFIAQPTDIAAFRFRPEQEDDAIDVAHLWKKRQMNQARRAAQTPYRLRDADRRAVAVPDGARKHGPVRSVLGLPANDTVDGLARGSASHGISTNCRRPCRSANASASRSAVRWRMSCRS